MTMYFSHRTYVAVFAVVCMSAGMVLGTMSLAAALGVQSSQVCSELQRQLEKAERARDTATAQRIRREMNTVGVCKDKQVEGSCQANICVGKKCSGQDCKQETGQGAGGGKGEMPQMPQMPQGGGGSGSGGGAALPPESGKTGCANGFTVDGFPCTLIATTSTSTIETATTTATTTEAATTTSPLRAVWQWVSTAFNAAPAPSSLPQGPQTTLVVGADVAARVSDVPPTSSQTGDLSGAPAPVVANTFSGFSPPSVSSSMQPGALTQLHDMLTSLRDALLSLFQ